MATVYTFTDKNVRSENQDNFLVSEFKLLTDDTHTGYLALVADGVGGLSRGKEASSIATSLFSHTTDYSLSSIERLFSSAHSGILGLGSAGSTLSLLRLYDGKYHIAHIGDTRIYHIPASHTQGTQLTKDHSAIQVLKDRGRVLTSEDYTKYAGKLVKGLGHGDTIDPDYLSGTYSSGDSFLLCSDGFWHGFEMLDVTLPSLDHEGLLYVADFSTSQGETDNLTAVLITNLQVGGHS